jgi:hypothetical protein
MLCAVIFRTMNEGIVQALKNIENDLRLINHNRWMVWNDTNKEWEVYESKNGKMGKLIIGTRNEGVAVYHLLNE